MSSLLLWCCWSTWLLTFATTLLYSLILFKWELAKMLLFINIGMFGTAVWKRLLSGGSQWLELNATVAMHIWYHSSLYMLMVSIAMTHRILLILGHPILKMSRILKDTTVLLSIMSCVTWLINHTLRTVWNALLIENLLHFNSLHLVYEVGIQLLEIDTLLLSFLCWFLLICNFLVFM